VAAREAMVTTFFHWGFHAWAIYAIVGLVLAYFGFRYNLPLTIRSGLYPIFKEKIHGPSATRWTSSPWWAPSSASPPPWAMA
jgi:choline/glycine/proline betaine transport protein